MKTLRFSLLAMVLVIILVVTACSQATTTPGGATPPTGTTAKTTTGVPPTATTKTTVTPQRGGIYINGSSVPIVTVLREAVTGMGIENAFDRVAHDTLLRLDEKGNLAPYLATAWNIDSTNNAITLTLRKGVKFHDGTDFNASALKFSWDLRKSCQAQTAVAPNTAFASVKSIEVVD
jgi:ABC-type transport system substrate-binding protein